MEITVYTLSLVSEATDLMYGQGVSHSVYGVAEGI